MPHSGELPQGPECLGRGPFPFGEETNRPMQNKFNNAFRSDLLPLEVKWACICAGKELRFTQDECVVRKILVAAFWTSVAAVVAFGFCGGSTFN